MQTQEGIIQKYKNIYKHEKKGNIFRDMWDESGNLEIYPSSYYYYYYFCEGILFKGPVKSQL